MRFMWMVLACALVGLGASAAENAQPGVVSHIQVLSDKVPDVSSMEAWNKSFIKEGMSDADKALAIWKSVVMFGLEGAPLKEHNSSAEPCVHDVMKIFNVYGCNFCCCSAAMIESLARYVGLEARGWNLHGHCVSEISYDGAWHLLDAAYINYFLKADGKVAGVEEIRASAKEWFDKNPGYVNNVNKLHQFAKNNGWKNGPPLLATCPTFDADGRSPISCGSWATSMVNFDGGAGGTPKLYDHGYNQGYQVNVQLRKGERLTRHWSNQGTKLPVPDGMPEDFYKLKVGAGLLSHTPKHGDLANGRLGHGLHEYDVPLADGAFRLGAMEADNLGCKAEDQAAPALHVKDAANAGTLIIRMPSSYVYLTGQVALKAVVGEGGEIVPAISFNNGLSFSELPKISASGEHKLDLTAQLARRYDYRLKLTLKGKGTGLEALKFSHDIMHSQRALPALGQGSNNISFSAEPAEGTITITGAPDPANTKQLKAEDFQPVYNNVSSKSWVLTAGSGDVTFKVSTPGEMTRLRFGSHYRARDGKDGWDYQVSFDQGKSFKTVARAGGPHANNSKYVSFAEIPAGSKEAWVRWSGTQRNTTGVMAFSINADYREPRGGFAPTKVTYLWEENGQPKQDVHVARQANETYKIECQSKPTMKSIVLEWAE